MTDYDQEIIAQLRAENKRLWDIERKAKQTIEDMERELEWFDAENERLRAALAATKPI